MKKPFIHFSLIILISNIFIVGCMRDPKSFSRYEKLFDAYEDAGGGYYYGDYKYDETFPMFDAMDTYQDAQNDILDTYRKIYDNYEYGNYHNAMDNYQDAYNDAMDTYQDALNSYDYSSYGY